LTRALVRAGFALLGVALAVVAGATSRGQSEPASAGGGGDPRKRATVTDVAEGDTIEVRHRGRLRDVRLVGIDTPEVFFGAECGGAEASDSIKRMLEVGEKVTLIRDSSQDNRDAFNRLLRYIEHGGRDIGRRQIRRGWAKVFVFESPFQRVSKYRKVQKRARADDRGVWGRRGGDFHQPLSAPRALGVISTS
jgi:endonuclease YncB( thermonuclease family)